MVMEKIWKCCSIVSNTSVLVHTKAKSGDAFAQEALECRSVVKIIRTVTFLCYEGIYPHCF